MPWRCRPLRRLRAVRVVVRRVIERSNLRRCRPRRKKSKRARITPRQLIRRLVGGLSPVNRDMQPRPRTCGCAKWAGNHVVFHCLWSLVPATRLPTSHRSVSVRRLVTLPLISRWVLLPRAGPQTHDLETHPGTRRISPVVVPRNTVQSLGSRSSRTHSRSIRQSRPFELCLIPATTADFSTVIADHSTPQAQLPNCLRCCGTSSASRSKAPDESRYEPGFAPLSPPSRRGSILSPGIRRRHCSCQFCGRPMIHAATQIPSPNRCHESQRSVQRGYSE